MERSRALLEKTKYALADDDLKRTEDVLQRQKDQKAAERMRAEDNKLATLMKKLQQSKQ